MCHLFLLLVWSTIIVNANLQQWEEFKLKYNKTYVNETEEARRYKIFTSRLKSIEEHNANYERGDVTWYQGVNTMLDWPDPEPLKAINISNYKAIERFHVPSGKKNPESIDWRDKGAVNEVQDQGHCSSCWSFAVAGTIEGIHAIKTGKLVKLSEQSLIDCASEAEYFCSGCNGGYLASALKYVQDHGIDYYENYPYKEVKGTTCRRNGSSVLHISGYTLINHNDEDAILDAVANIGPVVVHVSYNQIRNYAGGIFKDANCSKKTDHVLLAVGYGSENGMDYWLLKNSWGTTWGMEGYMKMVRGENMCGIASTSSYANL